MNLPAARALAMVTLFTTMSACRPSLPRPTLPLYPTHDAPFRARPPAPLARRSVSFPAIEQFELDDGVRVYVLSRPGSGVVVARYVCRRGGEQEFGVHEGLPLLVAAWIARSAVASARRAAATTGMTATGGADHDSSFIEVDASSANLDTAIFALSDAVRSPRLDQDSFESIRAAMLQHRLETPESVDLELARSGIYAGAHPYGRPITGRALGLQRIGLDEAVTFFRSRYVARESAIVIVGDVTREQAETAARRGFGDWQTPAAPTRRTLPPPDNAPRRAIFLDSPRSAVVTLVVAHPAVSPGSDDYPAMTLVDAVLGGMFSSRLNLSLREEQGYAYSAHSQSEVHHDGGVLLLKTVVSRDRGVAALGEIVAQTERLRTEAVTSDELEAARETWRTNALAAFERPDRATDVIGDLFAFDLPADAYQTLSDRIDHVTPDDLLRVAARHLARDRAQLVVVGDREQLGGDFERRFGQFDFRVRIR